MVVPKSYVEILTPKDDVIRWWDLWEVSRSWCYSLMKLVFLSKDTPEIPRLFLNVRVKWEGTNYEPGRGFSSEQNNAGNLILDFSASSIVGNRFLLFISHPVSIDCIARFVVVLLLLFLLFWASGWVQPIGDKWENYRQDMRDWKGNTNYVPTGYLVWLLFHCFIFHWVPVTLSPPFLLQASHCSNILKCLKHL